MEKSFILEVNDLRRDLAERVNNSRLPFCVIEPILKDMHEQSVEWSREELRREQKAYEEASKKEAEQKKENQPEKVEAEVVSDGANA